MTASTLQKLLKSRRFSDACVDLFLGALLRTSGDVVYVDTFLSRLVLDSENLLNSSRRRVIMQKWADVALEGFVVRGLRKILVPWHVEGGVGHWILFVLTVRQVMFGEFILEGFRSCLGLVRR